MFQRLKQQWQAWRDRRFLKRHRCGSWAEYHRIYDPDYNCRASRIRDFYHGYPYVYCFEDYKHYSYQMIADYGPAGCKWGYNVIHQWTEEHSQDKARFDFLRVNKSDHDRIGTYDYDINDIAGQDMVFAAFKNERDYLVFIMRWA
jgi:hypothetical protein